jgi:hypothetical protein
VSAYCDDWEYLRVSVSSSGQEQVLTETRRYCPGGPDSDFDYSTQSYTGYEPTSMRAIRARYDPYEQTRGRVEQLKSLGHSVDKVRPSRRLCFLGTDWSFPGGVHYHGRNIHEYARRLQESVHCTAA